MAAITGRLTAKEDVTVFSIDGKNVLAVFQTGSVELTRETIDVPAAMDTWMKREEGRADWTASMDAIVAAAPKITGALVAGGTIVVSLTTTGYSFVGTGILTSSTYSVDNPIVESCTIVGAGADPTITPAT